MNLEMNQIPVSKIPRVVGECIYCARTDVPLGKEHAVPFGINGDWTLVCASCGECATITSQIEHDTLRGLWPAVRGVLALRTRRPRKRPKSLPLVLEKGGEQTTIDVQLSEFPTYLPIPVFPPAREVAGYANVPHQESVLQFYHICGPTFEDVIAQYPGTEFVGARLRFHPELFARTLLKIAFCAAVHVIGIDALRQSPAREVILGHDRDVFRWVGSWTGEQMTTTDGLHQIIVRASGRDIHVFVRLFGQFGAPEYHIVLGPAADSAVSSPDWLWP